MNWLKNLFKKQDEFTHEYGDTDTENQIQYLHVYNHGKFSHTVKLHYFTQEQFDKFSKVRDKVYDNYNKKPPN